jgi:DNA-binding transcriptional LysR family regulator
VDRRHLEFFVAVVDEGGFTKAADALRIAQPSLSQAIGVLERDLGSALFHRVRRQVRLTAAGEALLDPARRVLRDFKVAEESVDHVKGLESGRLDIATIPTLVSDPFARLVGVFRRQYPGIVVSTPDIDAGGGVEAAVSSGDCELGLTELPVTEPGLVGISLGKQQFRLVLPPGTSAPKKYPVTRFAELSFLVTPSGTSSRARLDDALAAGRVSRLRVAVETAHRDALVPLVLAGAGAAFLPEPMAALAGRLGATVVATVPVVTREYGLIHRLGPLSPAAAAFVATARQRL